MASPHRHVATLRAILAFVDEATASLATQWNTAVYRCLGVRWIGCCRARRMLVHNSSVAQLEDDEEDAPPPSSPYSFGLHGFSVDSDGHLHDDYEHVGQDSPW